MSSTIEQQKAKMVAQEAELQQLKAAKPEKAAPEKEYVEKATELAERQTELTHSTVEQIRIATKEATESERSYQIPERPAEKLAGEERLAVESVEKLREKSADRRDDKGQEAPKAATLSSIEQKEQQVQSEVQKQIIIQQQASRQPVKLSSLTWIYGVLLALAAIVAISLMFFGPK
jgi:cobalamin biosynthesis Mg chelatase CobN